eukprot:2121665-Rhodomonas_salina.1
MERGEKREEDGARGERRVGDGERREALGGDDGETRREALGGDDGETRRGRRKNRGERREEEDERRRRRAPAQDLSSCSELRELPPHLLHQSSDPAHLLPSQPVASRLRAHLPASSASATRNGVSGRHDMVGRRERSLAIRDEKRTCVFSRARLASSQLRLPQSAFKASESELERGFKVAGLFSSRLSCLEVPGFGFRGLGQ